MEFEKKLEKKAINTGRGEIVYFLNNGFPGRPTVILLHGLSANHTTWLKIMEMLHAHKYNVIAPDLRGHGFSDKTKKRPLYKIPVFTEDLNDIVKKEKVGNFVLVGYSFGGSIALDYATKHPDHLKGLILISVNHVNPLRYKKTEFLTPPLKGFFNSLSFLFLWQKRKKYRYYRLGESRGYWHSVWIGLNTMPLSVNSWMLSEMGNVSLEKEIGRIKAPTLMIRGKKDPFVSEAEMKDMVKSIPRSETMTFQNPSHFIGSRSQNELAEAIFQFLEKNNFG